MEGQIYLNQSTKHGFFSFCIQFVKTEQMTATLNYFQSYQLNQIRSFIFDQYFLNQKYQSANQKVLILKQYSFSSLDIDKHLLLMSNQSKYFNYEVGNQGLPNVGNTCFLNSAIQFLYGSKDFKTAIANLTNLQKNSFCYYFQKIFQSIKNKCPYTEKEELMRKFAGKLAQIYTDYNQFSQQDSFQFILVILDNLSAVSPSIIEIFQLYYRFVCQNCQNSCKYTLYALSNQNKQCESCRGQMNIRFINTPPCIIIKNIHENSRSSKLFYTLNNKTIKYKLIAKIIYSGNKKFGHYKACRKNNEDDAYYSVCNDQWVRQQSEYTLSYQKSFLQLFQLQEQEPSNNSKFNNAEKVQAKKRQVSSCKSIEKIDQIEQQAQTKKQHQINNSLIKKCKLKQQQRYSGNIKGKLDQNIKQQTIQTKQNIMIKNKINLLNLKQQKESNYYKIPVQKQVKTIRPEEKRSEAHSSEIKLKEKNIKKQNQRKKTYGFSIVKYNFNLRYYQCLLYQKSCYQDHKLIDLISPVLKNHIPLSHVLFADYFKLTFFELAKHANESIFSLKDKFNFRQYDEKKNSTANQNKIVINTLIQKVFTLIFKQIKLISFDSCIVLFCASRIIAFNCAFQAFLVIAYQMPTIQQIRF